MLRTLAFTSLLLASTAAAAQLVPDGNSKPQPIPFENTIPAPQDIEYPGTMTLDIDASDTSQGIFRVKEALPVAQPGPMVLLYPKWLPGNHSPTGQLDKLTGLVITGDKGQPIRWTRDPVDVYAYHIDVPEGVKTLNMVFQFASATAGNQGRIVMTPNLISLQWNSMSLYPAGYFTRGIGVQATVHYPAGFTASSALPSTAKGPIYSYQKTNYEILVDSPVLAGRYYKQWVLSPKVNLDVYADKPADLAATPEQIDAHKRLVDQAVKTFGAQHYDHYDFLLSLSDQLGGIGLEHHRSSEDGAVENYFTDWNNQIYDRNLLPHEYTHSWNGKFRRGADLWTPNFDVPMRDSLLWVYEGQTQFWGYVLQARSGLVSKADTLDEYAMIAAYYDHMPARQWRDLLDTTNDPIISQRRPKGWTSWQRSEDYYNEGLMVWMEVDSILRQQSHGTKSIDDFARAFFGINDGDWGEVTYTFNDVVNTLNSIQPYDWAGFLTERLQGLSKDAPLNGFVQNGYKLVYTDQESTVFKQAETNRKKTDASYSIGLAAGNDGDLVSVIWDSPAFKAGLDLGDTIVAINGKAYSGDVLKDAIVSAKTDKNPIHFTVKRDGDFRDVAIDYHDGPRYPHLVKVGTGETGLDKLLEPRP
ncbi:M61 family metallopeptidase [Hephaestia mangrovi]|uniref:M61 family metallopeptidase n=1 Tax=Hephaestia mangrovi TaxID=2873268 RepID=UPI001CA707A3|nr:PDZ domain-containing protein [Hephaestia mangrovi]MBY8828163.1 PDZ domain-containing protein [Hephaestia mangrovi]